MRAKTDLTEVALVRLTPDHLKETAEIESLCFSEPWSEEALLYMCTSPHTYALAVMNKKSGAIMAYAGAEYVLDEASIVNVATHPVYRRKGYASMLLRGLEEFLKENGVRDVYLEVRASNVGARMLYEREGYSPLGVRKNYYRFPVEDAIVMGKKIN